MVHGAKACVKFSLLRAAQVGAYGIGPSDLPDVQPRVGLHVCLDSPKGYGKKA
jgi:hypothetical protein